MSLIRVILTDIEGTTSSLSVLKDLLAPYARRHLPSYLAAHREEPEVREAIQATRALAQEPSADDARVVALLLGWLDEDRKAPPLKLIQGLVWERGYRNGELKGHLFPDVVPALRAFKQRDFGIYVYSSGSLLAQRLFFAHSVEGDVSGVFDGFFDTTSGPKNAPDSYLAIAKKIGIAPASILFLSDAQAELDAARQAGLCVLGVKREGNAPVTGHRCISEFNELPLEPSIKSAWTPPGAGELSELSALARTLSLRGHVAATSGNFSLRLDAAHMMVTVSGRDKGGLSESDFVTADLTGRALLVGVVPSAEARLHGALYRARPLVNSVAHTHSPAATVLSRRHARAGVLRFGGFEMQKAFAGVTTHNSEITIPIVPNDQDMQVLERALDNVLLTFPAAPAYLVAGHGLTTWASDVPALKRHIEALEFLFECALLESIGPS